MHNPRNTCARGQHDGSSKQTPSNDIKPIDVSNHKARHSSCWFSVLISWTSKPIIWRPFLWARLWEISMRWTARIHICSLAISVWEIVFSQPLFTIIFTKWDISCLPGRRFLQFTYGYRVLRTILVDPATILADKTWNEQGWTLLQWDCRRWVL